MRHDPTLTADLTEAERAATEDAMAFLAGMNAMDPEARDMFVTAFTLAVKAETDAEADKVMEDFRRWILARPQREA